MLVSFSVENFRSFASPQAISLVAGAGAKRQRQFAFSTGNPVAPDLLRSICVFGPNGAGKSVLVGAFEFFREFVISSAKDTQEGEEIDVTPFKLDQKWRKKPSEFEATFIHGGGLYQYGFSVDRERVHGEWLFYRPNRPNTKTRVMFQREYDKSRRRYEWNISKAHVKGEPELWRRSTRDNALFLSTAIQLKSESLREPFDWIRNFLRVVESPDRLSPAFTARQCVEAGWKDKVLELLKAADIRISDIDIDVREFDINEMSPEIFSESMRDQLRKSMAGAKAFQIQSYHKDSSGDPVQFDFEDESDGSRLVFGIAGPWLDVLENGYTLVIDELHNSLHPHALKFLVQLFHNASVNKKNAQLIFTSHETSVMAKGFMHQDQIWLIEKGEDERSVLYPLSDFKVRDVAAFQRAYLEGRYGAVPRIAQVIDG